MNEKSTLEISIEDIKNSIEAGFSQAYKPFAKYQAEEGELWVQCMTTVSDIEKLKAILFINQVLKIPPVKVFVELYPDVASKLNIYDKKFIGAFWGYVFKECFGYKNQKQVGINNKNLKTGTYFYDNDCTINIIENQS